MTSRKNYDGMCISSGGYKGFGVLGALAILDIHGYMDKMTKFSGCSVGAIITLLIACGWKPIELYRRSISVKIFSGLSDINIEKFKTEHGLVSIDPLRRVLESLIVEKRYNKTVKLPTLLDLHNEGFYLAFSVCDRISKAGRKIDYISNPTLLASEAALMSSNMPFIFPPMEFEGMLITDGALTNPFPLEYIDNGDDSILGIVVYGKESDRDSIIDHITETLMISIEEMQRFSTRRASSKVDVLEMIVEELNYLAVAGYKVRNSMFFKGMEDGKVLIAALRRTKRRERRRSKHNKRKDKVNKHEEIKEEKFVKVPLRSMPDEIIVKCLMSQPLDILVQISIDNPESLDECMGKLSKPKLDRLKRLARHLIADEIESGVHVRTEEPAEEEEYDRIKIKENYSQKMYDTMPPQFRNIAKVVVDSMTNEQAAATITGVNIIIEGLKRLGVDIFQGSLLGGVFGDDEPEPFGNNNNNQDFAGNSRVEILDDDEIAPSPGLDVD